MPFSRSFQEDLAGYVLHGSRIAQPRSSVRRHTGKARTYGRTLYARGVSEVEAGDRQYFIRQESGLREADMPCRMDSAATCGPDPNTPARSAALEKALA